MTYIERPGYYTSNRVFIVIRKTPAYVVGSWLNLDTWRRNNAKLLRKDFYKRFEIAPLQFK